MPATAYAELDCVIYQSGLCLYIILESVTV